MQIIENNNANKKSQKAYTALKNKPAEMPVLFVFTVFEEAAPHDGAAAVFLTDGIKGLI